MSALSHLAFVSSFVGTFALLLSLSSYINARLNAAGYYVSDLILLGLPKNVTDYRHDPPAPSAFSMLDFTTTQVAALAFALLTSVILYVKFGSSKKKGVLDPAVWKEFPLSEKIIISPNTAIYRFALPEKDDFLGLPTGQHVSVGAEIDGKEIVRSYTPVSSDNDLGHFDLLIKSYEKGNISRYIGLLKIGQKVRVKGPKGQFRYAPSLTREIGMIAGGTGITPMIQIIRQAVSNPLDRTKISLIYANVNFEDILLKKELDALASQYPARFSVYYVLNNPPAGWTGGVGFVSKAQIEERLPPASHDIKMLLCGPPPMITAMKKHLDELKYTAPRAVSKLEDQVFCF